MARNNRQTRSRRQTKAEAEENRDMSELSLFDRAAKGIYSVLDRSFTDQLSLDAKDQKFRSILNRELEISKGYSQGSIVDFVASMKSLKNPNNMGNRQTNNSNLTPATNDLFTKNINDIFSYFQDMYRNKFIEMTDLKFVTRFIPALGQAVRITLDSVVATDSISDSINRTINLPSGLNPSDETAIRNEIERMEKELNLLPKLKNIVYKKALVTGTHYVYCVSYNRIFEEYDIIKKKQGTSIDNMKKTQFGNYVEKSTNNISKESYMLGDIDITPAMENIHTLLSTSQYVDSQNSEQVIQRMPAKSIKDRMNNLYESLPQITMESCNIYSDAMEEASTLFESDGALEAFFAVLEKKQANGKNSNDSLKINPLELHIPDGTIGNDKRGNTKSSKFNISGSYVKYIDAKQLIPLKVFDQTIGYYLIHPKAKKNRNSVGEVSGINSIGNTLFSAVNIGEAKKHDAVQRIVDTISDGILNSFNKKFVTKNAEYKKMIADVIIANGLTDKDYSIQFIPEGDIIPFTVQENEEGFGESILADSLFPAKLLMSMVVTRMLNYINKTGNKTIAHIHKGNINTFDSNQVQRVIRDLQDQDVTFNDLLSPNLVFNKFNRDGNYVLPTSRSNDRLVEFEQQEGQNIDMNPEYEQQLNNWVIMGTGVPPSKLDESADFAKQVVSDNIIYAGRIASLQADLETPTTILYKKLIENSNLTDEQKAICSQSMGVSLPRPRVIINANNSDFLSTLQQATEAIADIIIGRESAQNPDMPELARVKEVLMLELAKKNAPFLEWDELEELMRNVMLRVKEEKVRKEKTTDDNDQNDGMSGGNDSGDLGF